MSNDVMIVIRMAFIILWGNKHDWKACVSVKYGGFSKTSNKVLDALSSSFFLLNWIFLKSFRFLCFFCLLLSFTSCWYGFQIKKEIIQFLFVCFFFFHLMLYSSVFSIRLYYLEGMSNNYFLSFIFLFPFRTLILDIFTLIYFYQFVLFVVVVVVFIPSHHSILFPFFFHSVFFFFYFFFYAFFLCQRFYPSFILF